MSGSVSNISLGTIGADAGVPTLNVADIPANIRTGNAKAKEAYSEGLAFEDMFVNELTQQLAGTMFGGDGSDGTDGSDDTDGSDASDGSGGGLLQGTASAYSSLIPQALSQSIMSGGGIGMAEQFAQELDPALLDPPSAGHTGARSR